MATRESPYIGKGRPGLAAYARQDARAFEGFTLSPGLVAKLQAAAARMDMSEDDTPLRDALDKERSAWWEHHAPMPRIRRPVIASIARALTCAVCAAPMNKRRGALTCSPACRKALSRKGTK